MSPARDSELRAQGLSVESPPRAASDIDSHQGQMWTLAHKGHLAFREVEAISRASSHLEHGHRLLECSAVMLNLLLPTL